MIQRYDQVKFIEICLIDDGISIPGCYRFHGLKKGQDGISCLKAAFNGLSTKKEEKRRGFGLGTSLKITLALEGQFMLVSGNAAIVASPTHRVFYKLDQHLSFDGTLITLRLPFPTKDLGEEFYEYLK